MKGKESSWLWIKTEWLHCILLQAAAIKIYLGRNNVNFYEPPWLNKLSFNFCRVISQIRRRRRYHLLPFAWYASWNDWTKIPHGISKLQMNGILIVPVRNQVGRSTYTGNVCKKGIHEFTGTPLFLFYRISDRKINVPFAFSCLAPSWNIV